MLQVHSVPQCQLLPEPLKKLNGLSFKNNLWATEKQFLLPLKTTCVLPVKIRAAWNPLLGAHWVETCTSSLNARFLRAWTTKWSSSLPSASHKDHIMPRFYILWVPTNQADCKTGLSLCKRCKLLLLKTCSLHGNKLLHVQLQTVAKIPTCTFPACFFFFFLVLVFLSLLWGNWLPPSGRLNSSSLASTGEFQGYLINGLLCK